MEISSTKKPNKYVALATYLIAVVCLLLGLFLPLFDGKNILALQLPDVFNKIANKQVISTDKTFNLSYNVNLFGLGKINFDLMAWIVLLYTAVTALSLLALIPIGISTKRGTKTAHIFMYVVETAAVLVLSLYVVIALQFQRNPLYEGLPLSNFCYNMLIALGGSLLMLIVLSLLYKKGAGASKFFLLLLSAVGLLTLYDLALIIPKLGSLKLPAAFYSIDQGRALGITYLNALFNNSFGEFLAPLPNAKSKAALVFGLMVSLLVLINFFIDVISLSTNAKRAGYTFNLVRYGFELIVLICFLITVAICGYDIGLFIIVLAIAALIQFEISIGRFFMEKKRAKAAKAAKAEEDEQIIVEHVRRPANNAYKKPAEQARPNPVNREVWKEPHKPAPAKDEPLQMEIVDIEPEPVLMEKPEKLSEPAPAQPRANTVNRIYEPERPQSVNRPYEPEHVKFVNPVYGADTTKPVTASQPAGETRIYTINTIYGGPVDDFIKKLSNDEKIEFAMTFIEKSKGNVGNIPEYVIGGDNRKFFSAVFIYLGRIRGLISDGLLNKMYKELNML